jgi:hypothetical protein
MLLGVILTLAMQAGSSPVQTVVTDTMSHVDMPKQAVARTADEWAALWKLHAGDKPAPKVDLATRMVVAVFLGSRMSGGFAAEITGTRRSGQALIVEWRERKPEAGMITAQVITSPAHIATIPKAAGEIRFEKVDK